MKRADLFAITLHTSLLRLIGQFIVFLSGLAVSSAFGATSATDSYYAALILTASLANLIMNILTNLFTPVYLAHLHRDSTQQQPLLASSSFVTTVAISIGVIISLAVVPVSIALRNIQAPHLIQAIIFGATLATLTPIIGFTHLLNAICEVHGSLCWHFRVERDSEYVARTATWVNRYCALALPATWPDPGAEVHLSKKSTFHKSALRVSSQAAYIPSSIAE